MGYWQKEAERVLRIMIARAHATKGLAADRPWCVSITMVGRARMQKLNHAYRGKRQATDVLSFQTPRVFAKKGFLGDIVICAAEMNRQARALGHAPRHELEALVAHGLLHLLGFDHERSAAQARVMARWERKLLTGGGPGKSGLAVFRALIPLFVAVAAAGSASAASDDDFSRGFGASGGINEIEKLDADKDRLKIGGTVMSEVFYYGLWKGPNADHFMAPQNLWVYGDARLRNDIRALARGRLTFDPAVNEAAPSPLTGVAARRYTSSLDELKLNFNAARVVYFTAGRQKIKWGSGRFWNPSDFINAAKRDLLRQEDERAGVTLLKTHVPVGTTNFYLIQNFEDSARPERMGHAFRMETAFSPVEIAVSGAARKGLRPQAAFDISAGIWDVDVWGEAAYSHGSDLTFYKTETVSAAHPLGFSSYKKEKTAFVKATIGASYEIKYGDKDTITFTGEYFRNAEGYSDTGAYSYVLAAGFYTPYFLGRDYAMLSIYLPDPGDWKDIAFTLWNVMNVSDTSAHSRIETRITLKQDLKFNLAFGGSYGNGRGEFRFGGQTFVATAGLRVDF
ncbi:MAG: rRNA maturation RNase YbeY [Bdellovibrionales bacterium RIFOXYD1_FULL_53_11]|nr:MAG: rRNA maturation RNase YbeY [Bdellovibrionales bacterium RIFOXYD1_FULL_53_11]